QAALPQLKLMIDVFDKPGGERVAARVLVIDTDGEGKRLQGTSKAAPAEASERLTFEVPQGHTYIINAEKSGNEERQVYVAKGKAEELVTLALTDPSIKANNTRLTLTVFDRPAGKW